MPACGETPCAPPIGASISTIRRHHAAAPGHLDRLHTGRAKSTLSERMRAAFVLFEIEGYTTAEIAILNRVSINTVRAQIHRARKKLFVLLEERRAIDDSGNDWNTCMIIADSRVGKTRDAVSASPSCQPLVD